LEAQAAKITGAMEQGTLMRLDPGTDNFIDLVRGLAALAGGPDLHEGTPGSDLQERIGASEHLVFVLVDGLGINLLEQLPQTSFLRSHLEGEMRAVFPSTTACALTALATGQWPAAHGIPGWWAYLAERDLSVVTLRYETRFGGKDLQREGVNIQDLWPIEAWMANMARDALSYIPRPFWNSTFSRYLRGGQPGWGYSSVVDACERACMRVIDARIPTFTFLYLPELDSASHRYGWDSYQAHLALRLMDAELMRLAEGIDGKARLVISADHGHMNIQTENRLPIYADDPMLKLLKAPPTGEPRTPVFHVHEGQGEAFVAEFAGRFGDKMALIDIDTAAALQLFGPGPLSDAAKNRFGDFIGIALEPVTLQYFKGDETPETAHIGYHAGLTPEEMRIPLIMA